jgi:hypothetical protein
MLAKASGVGGSSSQNPPKERRRQTRRAFELRTNEKRGSAKMSHSVQVISRLIHVSPENLTFSRSVVLNSRIRCCRSARPWYKGGFRCERSERHLCAPFRPVIGARAEGGRGRGSWAGRALIAVLYGALPVDLVRHYLIMNLAPVPDETLIEIVDRIFLPLVGRP